MNQKEINELRRRFRPEKSAISRVDVYKRQEQRFQLGSVMVADGSSRFWESVPAANICNLVHKTPTFVVVSLDRERSGPAPLSLIHI